MSTTPPPVVSTERARLEAEQLRRLAAVAVVEATTLLLLVGVAVPLKHFAGWPTGVRVLGPVHGLAFAAYLWTAIETAAGGGWTGGDAARIVAAAFVPFGGFLTLPRLRRRAAAAESAAIGSATA